MTEEEDIITVTREFDARRDEVWEAWTDPGVLSRWWWPPRFQTTYRVDLRLGGEYRFRSADIPGMGVLSVSGTYLEIYPPQQLVYTWEWDGQDLPPNRVTVDFLDHGGHTAVRITQQGLETVEERENHVIGWRDCLDRLDAVLGPQHDFSPATEPA